MSEKLTLSEIALDYPIVSDLLDIVIDEIERHRERIEYLEKMKARLERLILTENDNEQTD